MESTSSSLLPRGTCTGERPWTATSRVHYRHTAMDARWRRLAGLAALAAGFGLIIGSFLPWEHSFSSISGASSHSGLDCYCGGGPTFALGVILMGLGSPYLGEGHPWLPPFARAIAWIPTTILSVVAGWVVAVVWAEALEDSSAVAVGIGIYVMAAGAVLGLIGGMLMRAGRPKPGRAV